MCTARYGGGTHSDSVFLIMPTYLFKIRTKKERNALFFVSMIRLRAVTPTLQKGILTKLYNLI
jgi:hypothetical protein